MTDNSPKKILVYAVSIAETASQSSPYALGLLIAYAKTWQMGKLNEYFDFDPVICWGIEEEEFVLNVVRENRQPTIYLFSSFVWNHNINLQTAAKIKEIDQSAYIVFGGPHIPRKEQASKTFLTEHSHIDLLIMGEGEESLSCVFERFAEGMNQFELRIGDCDLTGIAGAAWRSRSGALHYNGSRSQIQDINCIPSPYLAGVFAAETIPKSSCWQMESNRGCPFGCTFCDWGGATLSKVRKYDIARIKKEIDWMVEHQVPLIGFADANFGMLQRDEEIVDYIIEKKAETGFPFGFVTNYAKNSAKRVAKIVSKLHKADMLERFQVSFQTFDEAVLKNIVRDNIKTSDFEELLCSLKAEGVPLTTDLMIGLPGQTFDSFKMDLQRVFDFQVDPSCFHVSILPNAPMAEEEYIERFQLEIDDRNNVISSSSFTHAEKQDMIKLRFLVSTSIQQKVLKYFLIFYQIDHGVMAMDVLAKLVHLVNQPDDRYPLLTWYTQNMACWNEDLMRDYMLVHWGTNAAKIFNNAGAFYDELVELIKNEFGVCVKPKEVSSLKSIQRMALRRVKPEYGRSIVTQCDVIAYFNQFNSAVSLAKAAEFGVKPLRSFPPGVVSLDGTKFESQHTWAFVQSNMMGSQWPLKINGLSTL